MQRCSELTRDAHMTASSKFGCLSSGTPTPWRRSPPTVPASCPFVSDVLQHTKPCVCGGSTADAETQIAVSA